MVAHAQPSGSTHFWPITAPRGELERTDGRSGSLTKAGAGTLILAGANTYGGATNVAWERSQAGSLTALSANSAFNVASELDLNGFKNAIGSLAGKGTVTNNAGLRRR